MLATNIGTGLVVGQFVLPVVDGPDLDREPELVPMSGEVTFTPSISHLPVIGDTPEDTFTLVMAPIKAILDNGFLCTPSADGVTPQYQGIRLIATDAPNGLTKNWFYTVTYRFKVINGVTPSIKTHPMAVLVGSERDLTRDVDVPSSPAIGTPQAFALLAKAEAAATYSATSAEEAAAVALQVKADADAGVFDGKQGIPGPNTVPTDQAVAGNILDPQTETARALSGTIADLTAELTGALGVLRAGLAKVDTDPCVIVATGSSTTGGHNTAPAKRWLNLLSATATAQPVRTLAEAVAAPKPLAAGIHVVNAGINGADTGNYLTTATIAQIAALNPRMVTHMIGSNDWKNGSSPAAAKANIQAKINALKAAMNGPCVHLLIHPYERYDYVNVPATWSDYRNMLREIAAADPTRVAFLDISAPFYNVGIPSTDPLGLMQGDRIHMNDAGHRLMAGLMIRALALPPLAVSSEPSVPPLAGDSFDRSNGPLGLTPYGRYPWTYQNGTMEIINNQARSVNATGGAGVKALVDLGITNVSVKAKAGTLNAGVAARYNANGSGYVFIYSQSAGTYRLSSQTDGASFAPLAVAVGVTPVAGDLLELIAIGSSLTGKINGVTVLTATDATHTGTRYGMVTLNNESPFDNFECVQV